MTGTTAAFSRVRIDALLADAGWNLTDGTSVLFEAGAVTRVLFLVDRIALAAQAEDAFTDHLRDYPCHVLRPGQGFDRAKRVTIATLQTMIAEYGRLSSGYFDLVITDECHRSIYGRWSGALRHFDGIQLGLTATPCTADAARATGGEADPEDGRFVRDTLRFFEVERPTFRYTMFDEHFADLKPRAATRYADFVVSDVEGGTTERVMFLHADNDGFKLDANHDRPIEAFAPDGPLFV